jgi:unconventional prefoldin RPB5 interactor 1
MAEQLSDSSLADLEKHRQLLESQIIALRKALAHWRTWSAEYEGLKEEIEAADVNPTTEQLLGIGRTYDGELVTFVEIDELLHDDKTNSTRTAEQVLSLLDHRLDYVTKNVETAEKQLAIAEEKLEKVDAVKDEWQNQSTEEGGLPLTEIMEELDEEGNVLSSRTVTPGQQKDELVSVLKKAGVSEKDLGQEEIKANVTAPETTKKEAAPPKVEAKASAIPTLQHKPVRSSPLANNGTTSAGSEADERPKPKKGVSFADDTKAGPDAIPSRTQQRIDALNAISKELNTPIEEDNVVIPDTDTVEDAQLRREMLQYGMSEIGPIVAELEIEEGDGEWSDDDEGYDDEYADSDEESEDAFGRTTKPVITSKVHERMKELEEKLGLRMMTNLGPAPMDVDTSKTDEKGQNPEAGIAQIKITQEDVDEEARLERMERETPVMLTAADEMADLNLNTVPKQGGLAKQEKDGKKKGVRFNEELDISASPDASVPAAPKQHVQAPISDIVERKPPAAEPEPTAVDAPKPKKVSRFKAAKSGNAPSPAPVFMPPPFTPAHVERPLPTGPENATLAPQVVERDVIPSDNVAEPDELDPALLQQEVATEYHKTRNRMIQLEGGFNKPQEVVDEETGEILEDESETYVDSTGKVKKMSRFMRARLGKA